VRTSPIRTSTHRIFLIDTNTVSYIVRGKSAAARAKLASLKDDEIGCISSITEADIRYGLAKNPSVSLRAAIEGFLRKIKILAWGSDEALSYGELRAKLERSGKTLGSMDMLIAAHAISANATLVTNDKSFSHVRDLNGIVNWAVDL
jgi:tRNA(fMet)-specific endonuclease VapC